MERDLRNWTLGQYWTFSWKPFIFSPSSVQQRAYHCCHLCVACKKKHGVTGYGSQFSTLFLHMPACLIICWPIIIINQKVSRLNFLISMDFIIFVCLGDLCTSHRCCRRCRKCDVSYKKTIKIFYSVLLSNDIFIVVLIELLVVKLKFCSLNPSEKYLITIRVQYHLCQNFEPRHKTIITFAVAPCSTGKPSVGPPCWEHLTGCQMTCDPRVLPPAEWCLSGYSCHIAAVHPFLNISPGETEQGSAGYCVVLQENRSLITHVIPVGTDQSSWLWFLTLKLMLKKRWPNWCVHS